MQDPGGTIGRDMRLLPFSLKARLQRVFILLLCALIFPGCTSSYAESATPVPANMARVYVPKPGQDPIQQVLTIPTIPTAAVLPNAEMIQVSLRVPSYLAETLGGALEDPLRKLFVSDATLVNLRLEVGEGNLVSQWVYDWLVLDDSAVEPGVENNKMAQVI